jgi:deoxyribodipyrimidine photo-lyase
MNIFWFRRDLRLDDNVGLNAALKDGLTQGVFIFDKDILDKLEDKEDKRVSLIYDQLNQIHKVFQSYGSSLKIYYGKPGEVWANIVKEFDVRQVFFNKDYEPYAIRRDQEVVEFLNSKNIPHQKFLDHLVFQPNEVLKADQNPYTVFTPYSRKWKEKLASTKIEICESESKLNNLSACNKEFPELKFIGFDYHKVDVPDIRIQNHFLAKYSENRDFPSLSYTSKLSVSLRFGLVSIRKILIQTLHEEKFLNELIWREFYAQIMYHFPESMQNCFKKNYERIIWSNDMTLFQAWCQGITGFPLVDAGMRELNETGYMHNRVRMVVSCFLTKNLWIDWRLGERYFASKLLDFDLASNVGGWQWAASTGCDAVPYFRIFNPELQIERFDKDYKYIKRWVPEYGTDRYPKPIVDYRESRDQAIANYKKYLGGE